jgi:hypothetical protein
MQRRKPWRRERINNSTDRLRVVDGDCVRHGPAFDHPVLTEIDIGLGAGSAFGNNRQQVVLVVYDAVTIEINATRCSP